MLANHPSRRAGASAFARRGRAPARALGLWVAISSLGISENGEAAGRVALTYVADAGCPAEAEVVAFFEADLPEGGGTPTEVVAAAVRISAVRGGYRGVLTLEGQSRARTLSAPDCRTVARSLAFAAGLAIAQARQSAERSLQRRARPAVERPAVPDRRGRAAAPVPPPPVDPAPAARDAPPASASPPLATPPAPEPRPSPLPAAPPPPVPPGAPERRSFGLLGQLEARTGLGGGIAPGAALVAELGRARGGLRVRLGLSYHQSRTVPAADAAARFSLMAARADGCLVRWRRDALTVVAPCLRFETGLVRGEGVRVPRPRPQLRPWAATGALARAEWALSTRLSWGGEVGALVPLSRHRFVFERPERGAYDVPWVALQVGLGVTGHF